MNPKWLSLPILLFCVNANAFQFPVEVIEQFDDARVVAFIHESDIEDSVRWDPLQEAPPLSIAKAIEVVKTQYIDQDPRYHGASVAEIELRQIPRHAQRWHYLLKLKNEVDGKREYSFFAVLMNGKAIPAIKEPESYK